VVELWWGNRSLSPQISPKSLFCAGEMESIAHKSDKLRICEYFLFRTSGSVLRPQAVIDRVDRDVLIDDVAANQSLCSPLLKIILHLPFFFGQKPIVLNISSSLSSEKAGRLGRERAETKGP